jgi:uncharacterized membrane protein YdjX (TVP38/TMEM64 family)
LGNVTEVGTGRRGRRRYLTVAGAILAFFVVTWLAIEALRVPALTDPEGSIDRGGAAGALIGVGLLVADALVPLPSSVVMIALGALYGAPAGIALALTGRTAMALLGFAIGRRGGRLMERVRADDRARAEALLERRGALAIVVSRPVPLLGETVMVLAGASGMPWRRAALAAFVGSLPEAVVYGLAGGLSASFAEGAVVWALLLALAAAFWLVQRRAGAEPDRATG